MNQSSRETVGTNIECPISRLLEIISAKWTVEILREISIAPTRTRQFLRLIPGLSMKSLQFRLKELEKFGLLERIEYDQLP
jgi:DNA-binding HxlR family transcriptional regulator